MASPAQVSCNSPEHYLPAKYAEAARRVLGRIGTDPASSPIANRTIGAERIFTVDNPGHVSGAIWEGPVLCNHPGSKDGSLMVAFWRRCVEHARRWPVIWVGYSLEQLRRLGRLAEDGLIPPSRLPMVIVRERIRWSTPHGRLVLSGRVHGDGDLRLAIGANRLTFAARAGMSSWELVADVEMVLEADEELELRSERDRRNGLRATLHVTSRERVEYPMEVLARPPGIKARTMRNEQPTHGNFFLLLGGGREHRLRFRREFSAFGDYFAPVGRIPTGRDLRAEIIRALGEEARTKNKLQRLIGARRAHVFAELASMCEDGLVVLRDGQWALAGESA